MTWSVRVSGRAPSAATVLWRDLGYAVGALVARTADGPAGLSGDDIDHSAPAGRLELGSARLASGTHTQLAVGTEDQTEIRVRSELRAGGSTPHESGWRFEEKSCFCGISVFQWYK